MKPYNMIKPYSRLAGWELLYPSPPTTPSPFGARLTPLNLANARKNKQTSLRLSVINPIHREAVPLLRLGRRVLAVLWDSQKSCDLSIFSMFSFCFMFDIEYFL